MNKRKTKSMTKIYNFIKQYSDNYGYPPSVREICEGVGFSSTSTVHLHLSSLEKAGYIRRHPTRPRAIEILDRHKDRQKTQGKNVNIQEENTVDADQTFEDFLVQKGENTISAPVVGQVTAGAPILADENIQEYFPLPSALYRGKDVFLLRIEGDSMKDAGILDSDYVIVNQQNTADPGDIVVALMEEEEEATVKRFYKENDIVKLQPENPLYSPIYTKNVKIIGKVTGLFRYMG